MAAETPIIYLFHGEDEFSITRELAGLKAKMGDPSLAELNTTRLDGRTLELSDLDATSKAMPFLSNRRLVVVTSAAAPGETHSLRVKYLQLLKECPRTTALVLIEDHQLTDYRMEKKGELHWLEEWARKETGDVFIKKFQLPSGKRLVDWIVGRVNEVGGKITLPAADQIARQVGNDLWLVNQEIDKLLAYVNYDRIIEIEDVKEIVNRDYQDSIFDLVDSIGNRDRVKAFNHYHNLLADQDVLSVFGMIVRQFRLLLLTKEIVQDGGNAVTVSRKLKVQGFVSDKLLTQTRTFSLDELVIIYHQLLEIDEKFKTGGMEADLNLDLLIDSVTREDFR